MLGLLKGFYSLLSLSPHLQLVLELRASRQYQPGAVALVVGNEEVGRKLGHLLEKNPHHTRRTHHRSSDQILSHHLCHRRQKYKSRRQYHLHGLHIEIMVPGGSRTICIIYHIFPRSDLCTKTDLPSTHGNFLPMGGRCVNHAACRDEYRP